MIDPVDFKLELQEIATEVLVVGVPQAGEAVLLVG